MGSSPTRVMGPSKPYWRARRRPCRPAWPAPRMTTLVPLRSSRPLLEKMRPRQLCWSARMGQPEPAIEQDPSAVKTASKTRSETRPLSAGRRSAPSRLPRPRPRQPDRRLPPRTRQLAPWSAPERHRPCRACGQWPFSEATQPPSLAISLLAFRTMSDDTRRHRSTAPAPALGLVAPQIHRAPPHTRADAASTAAHHPAAQTSAQRDEAIAHPAR